MIKTETKNGECALEVRGKMIDVIGEYILIGRSIFKAMEEDKPQAAKRFADLVEKHIGLIRADSFDDDEEVEEKDIDDFKKDKLKELHSLVDDIDSLLKSIKEL